MADFKGEPRIWFSHAAFEQFARFSASLYRLSSPAKQKILHGANKFARSADRTPWKCLFFHSLFLAEEKLFNATALMNLFKLIFTIFKQSGIEEVSYHPNKELMRARQKFFPLQILLILPGHWTSKLMNSISWNWEINSCVTGALCQFATWRFWKSALPLNWFKLHTPLGHCVEFHSLILG